MTARRGTAVAIALLTAALATAGCGLGPGEDRGDVELTVTRDYGAESLLSRSVGDVTESDTVMRVLDRNAEITTRYGGGFVQSIEGLEGGDEDGHDWFFYVNGLWSPIGAAEYGLDGGETIWWDYRDWSVGERVAAAVGSWPEPFVDGYEGERHATVVVCLGGGRACDEVRQRLRNAGARLVGEPLDDAIRVLVGPWARVREDPDAAHIESGVEDSGVFADFISANTPTARSAVPLPRYLRQGNSGNFRVRGLDQEGKPIRAFGPGAGLVAATRRYDAPPTWVVTGATTAGVRAAAGLLNATDLRDHYAVATEGGEETPLPMGS